MLYVNGTKSNLFFVCLITLLLCIDLGQFFLMGAPITPLLLCIYCTLLCCDVTYTPLIIIALLQCLESFCFYNFFFLACIYLIPTTALAFFFKKNLFPSYAHTITLALIGTIIKIYIIEALFLHILPISYYTVMRINATLFITICFSLTIKIWGMQDNRA